MKAWNELHLDWKDQHSQEIFVDGGERGKERKIPQFDSILGHLCLVDKKQEGSAVVVSPQKTSDYWRFHKVVVFIEIFIEGCLSAHLTV